MRLPGNETANVTAFEDALQLTRPQQDCTPVDDTRYVFATESQEHCDQWVATLLFLSMSLRKIT